MHSIIDKPWRAALSPDDHCFGKGGTAMLANFIWRHGKWRRRHRDHRDDEPSPVRAFDERAVKLQSGKLYYFICTKWNDDDIMKYVSTPTELNIWSVIDSKYLTKSFITLSYQTKFLNDEMSLKLYLLAAWINQNMSIAIAPIVKSSAGWRSRKWAGQSWQF